MPVSVRQRAPARAILFLACLLSGAVAASAFAQSAADFYKGRTMTLVVGNSAGGGYDFYARLLARYLAKHTPGQPTIVVQNMAGAGGLIAANHIANVAPRDGSVFAMFPGSILLDSVLGNDKAKFSPDGFTPIGNMNAEYDNCVAWGGRGADTTDSIFAKEIVTGATGASSNSYIYPALLNEVLKTRFKLITGYSGNERVLIMEKGELDAACGVFTSTLLVHFADKVKSGQLKVLLQMGLDRHPAMPDVPSAIELAKTPEDRQVLTLAFSPLEMGRAFFAPPRIPADRVSVLQKAFSAAMNDPELQAEAAKANMELRWFPAARLNEVIAAMMAVPQPVKIRTKNLLLIKKP